MKLTPYTFDMSHRLGKYNRGRNKRVTVRFEHRRLKQDILSQRRLHKNTGNIISEDMTRINYEVLASTRKKLPNEIEKS